MWPFIAVRELCRLYIFAAFEVPIPGGCGPRSAEKQAGALCTNPRNPKQLVVIWHALTEHQAACLWR
jgi:hypothetical protein